MGRMERMERMVTDDSVRKTARIPVTETCGALRLEQCWGFGPEGELAVLHERP